MPSTLVHVAIGGLLGAALLGRWFDARSVAVVLAAAAVPDLDSFVGLVVPGAHRSLLHTLLLPALLVAVLAYDTRFRERSAIRRRWGTRGVVVAWVAVVSLLGGGIMPDLFTNGVNAFYPVRDAFYSIDGRLFWSSTRGFVQTFVDLHHSAPPATTENFRYVTVVDPAPSGDAGPPERIAPIVSSGMQFMLVLLGGGSVGGRLLAERWGVPAADDDAGR